MVVRSYEPVVPADADICSHCRLADRGNGDRSFKYCAAYLLARATSYKCKPVPPTCEGGFLCGHKGCYEGPGFRCRGPKQPVTEGSAWCCSIQCLNTYMKKAGDLLDKIRTEGRICFLLEHPDGLVGKGPIGEALKAELEASLQDPMAWEMKHVPRSDNVSWCFVLRSPNFVWGQLQCSQQDARAHYSLAGQICQAVEDELRRRIAAAADNHEGEDASGEAMTATGAEGEEVEQPAPYANTVVANDADMDEAEYAAPDEAVAAVAAADATATAGPSRLCHIDGMGVAASGGAAAADEPRTPTRAGPILDAKPSAGAPSRAQSHAGADYTFGGMNMTDGNARHASEVNRRDATVDSGRHRGLEEAAARFQEQRNGNTLPAAMDAEGSSKAAQGAAAKVAEQARDAAVEELTQVQDELAALRDRMQLLVTQQQAAAEGHVAKERALMDKLARVRQQAAAHGGALEVEGRKRQAAEAVVEEQRQQLAAAAAAAAEAETALESLSDEHAAASQSVLELKSAVQRKEREAAELQKRMDDTAARLIAANQSRDAAVEARDAALDDVTSLMSKIKKMAARVSDMETQASQQAAQHMATVKGLQAQLDAANARCARLQERVTELEREVHCEKKRRRLAEEYMKKVKARAAEVAMQHATEKTQMASAHTEEVAAAKAAHQASLVELQRQREVAVSNSYDAGYSQACDDMRDDKEQLEAQVKELTNRIQDLEQQLSEADAIGVARNEAHAAALAAENGRRRAIMGQLAVERQKREDAELKSMRLAGQLAMIKRNQAAGDGDGSKQAAVCESRSRSKSRSRSRSRKRAGSREQQRRRR